MLLFIKAISEKQQADEKFQYISCYSLSTCTVTATPQRGGFQYISCYSLSQIAGASSSPPDVSIHLMLLFISDPVISFAEVPLFQYISCYSLSIWQVDVWLRLASFQYISCYSLSVFCVRSYALLYRFNTSHVTLYRYEPVNTYHNNAVSIHLMLLFIHRIILAYARKQLFQYISCYSLSITFCVLCQSLFGFNTSHVTLYPLQYQSHPPSALFQYISCYSLSRISKNKKERQKQFQYISCYSLSRTIYTDQQTSICFNTSHVTLYLKPVKRLSTFFMFQYISCYSLSAWNPRTFLQKHVSIHLMLLFIN